MSTRPQPTSYSETAIRRSRELRRRRGWSVRHLADLLTAAGCPTLRTTLVNLECGRRTHLTVDELYALAGVFAMPVDRLTHNDPACPTCSDRPPVGFRCMSCGRDGAR